MTDNTTDQPQVSPFVPPPTKGTSVKTSTLALWAPAHIYTEIAKAGEIPIRDVRRWFDGDALPPEGFAPIARRYADRVFPTESQFISVPGDPDYVELRKRERANPTDPKEKQKLFLKEKGFTLERLSEDTGITLNTLRAILDGRNPAPTGVIFDSMDLIYMQKIAKACGVYLDQFPWLHEHQIHWASNIGPEHRKMEAEGIDFNDPASIDLAISGIKRDLHRAHAPEPESGSDRPV